MKSTKDFRRVARAAVRYVQSLEKDPEATDAALEELIEVVEGFVAIPSSPPKLPEVVVAVAPVPAEAPPAAIEPPKTPVVVHVVPTPTNTVPQVNRPARIIPVKTNGPIVEVARRVPKS